MLTIVIKYLFLSIALLPPFYCSAAYAVELTPPAMHALVIGNSNYINKPLTNPKQDALLMADTLKQIGFKTTLASDLDRKSFFSTIRTFYNTIPKGSVALVYYAGHGVQISGANYLIPVDMTLTSERGVEINAFPLKSMIDGLSQTKSTVTIIILDACRNNPFQPKSPSKYRSLEKMGLAKVSTPRGTIIAYSTAPGQLAEDGLGNKNSIYTSTLSDEIKKPGTPIEVILKKVADTVRRKTFEDQQPWYESSLADDFYFIPVDGAQILSPKASNRFENKKNIHASRGLSIKNNDAEIYAQLNHQDWSQLDYEIQQRVDRITEDELPLLTLRANKGNLIALTTLGIAYREGFTKVVDVGSGTISKTKSSNKKSVEMLTRAAKLGFPIAQTELGEMLYIGKHIEKDLSEAKRWLELASNANYPRAKIDLLQLTFMNNPNDPRIIKSFLKNGL